MKLKFKKLNNQAVMPTYGSLLAAGADLRAVIADDIHIAPHETKLIPTGIAVAIPAGYVGLVCARSGLASKQDLAPANKVGVIDSDYRGEIMVALHNHGEIERTVKAGERIAQMLIMPCVMAEFEEAESLDDTERGECGFGSTGLN